MEREQASTLENFLKLYDTNTSRRESAGTRHVRVKPARSVSKSGFSLPPEMALTLERKGPVPFPSWALASR